MFGPHGESFESGFKAPNIESGFGQPALPVGKPLWNEQGVFPGVKMAQGQTPAWATNRIGSNPLQQGKPWQNWQRSPSQIAMSQPQKSTPGAFSSLQAGQSQNYGGFATATRKADGTLSFGNQVMG